MQITINDLVGKQILIENKKYSVTDVRSVAGNVVVKTNVRAFNLYPSEVESWMDKIVVLEEKPEEKWTPESWKNEYVSDEGVYVPVSVSVPVVKEHVYQAEIMAQNQVSEKITDKLLKMFDEIDENPSDKAIKKAQTMVNVSNAIVAVQMANLKFLTLKSK